MSKVSAKYKYFSHLVNILIFLTLVSITVYVVRSYIASPKASPVISRGNTLEIRSVDWKNADQWVVLFLQTGCNYSDLSKPMYEKIAEKFYEDADRKLLIISPEKDSLFEKYIESFNVPGAGFVKTSFSKLGIDATPTMLLVDNTGVVQEVFKGKLPFKREMELLTSLGISVSDSRFVEVSDIPELNNNIPINVIDVRSRSDYQVGIHPSSKNIPLDELKIRAVNEFSLEQHIIIYGDSDDVSAKAYDLLKQEGFQYVKILKD